MMPSDVQRITVSIDFNSPVVGSQTLSVELVNEAFVQSVARARTFGFAHELETLQKAGLIQGGSLNNAILVDGERIVNEEGLRFKDEFVRHKVLDLIGDISLCGYPVIGHLVAFKAGHALHTNLATELVRRPSSWRLVKSSELESLSKTA
jgi:UDP-3-O-[3-hydroxymyristoyl] N-acetylglucosamine deacetylase